MTGLLKQPSFDALLDDVAHYYTHKITTHGPTPLGVDWSCVPTQQMRFVHLLKLCSFESATSLNDVGCGYGALLAFLAKRFRGTAIDYLGMDISPAMISHAQKLWRKRSGTQFVVASTSPRTADYSIASGIFNVKLKQPFDLWEQFIAKSLADMHTSSRRGFAVNFLTPPSTQTPLVPELYYAHPDVWREYCERTFNSRVQIVAGYGLREYTLISRSD